MAGKFFAFVGIALIVFVFLAIPLINETKHDKLPDYKNMKFEIGFTKNPLPTPYKNGSPQLLIKGVDV